MRDRSADLNNKKNCIRSLRDISEVEAFLSRCTSSPLSRLEQNAIKADEEYISENSSTE